MDHFEDDTADADVQTLLRGYADAAVAFVNGIGAPVRVRRRQRVVTIPVGVGEMVLRRTPRDCRSASHPRLRVRSPAAPRRDCRGPPQTQGHPRGRQDHLHE
jgi:hypothetical protein